MRNKKKKGKETMKIKAKKKAFIGVHKGLPVAQKAWPEGGIICYCYKAAWHVAVKQGTITMPYKMTSAK